VSLIIIIIVIIIIIIKNCFLDACGRDRLGRAASSFAHLLVKIT
jgi:hypothetical protein